MLMTWFHPIVPALQPLYLFLFIFYLFILFIFFTANKVWNFKSDSHRNLWLVFLTGWLRNVEQAVLPSFLCFHLPHLTHKVPPWVPDEEFLLKKAILRGFRRCWKEEFSMGKGAVCHSSRESERLDQFGWEEERRRVPAPLPAIFID